MYFSLLTSHKTRLSPMNPRRDLLLLEKNSSQNLQHSACAGYKYLFTAFVGPSLAQKLIEARESVADAGGA
jgi:hypothetical protein